MARHALPFLNTVKPIPGFTMKSSARGARTGGHASRKGI